MTHFCAKCNEPIENDDWITLPVTTRYKKLDSKIAFALNTGDITADTDEMCHSECKGRTVGF